MSDKDIVADILETEKNMVVNMAIALNEASCDEIYNLYYGIFKDLTKESKNLFNLAYNNSWYTLEEANSTKIKQEYNKLSNELK